MKKTDYNLGSRKFGLRLFAGILYFAASGLLSADCVLAQQPSDYIKNARKSAANKDFKKVYEITGECISKFSRKADRLSAGLSKFPAKGKEHIYKVMNDVATCYFIRGEALMRQGKTDKAVKVFRQIIKKYPYAQAWDPRGWFWSLKEKAEITVKKLTGRGLKEEEEPIGAVTKVVLSDPGLEFPVDYEKYGVFKNPGTENYHYVVRDPEGLARASGEGVYPNTTSLRYDPKFVQMKNKGYLKVNHWKVLQSRDLEKAFYVWNICPEPAGIRQFYIAEILEKSGLIKQAIKAYYSILVFFPKTYGWTYWHTPWYLAEAALSRIKSLLRSHPEFGADLVGAEFKIINGFDHNIANDKFIINPGRIIKVSRGHFARLKKRPLGKIVKETGTKVKLVQYESGDWQLFVNGKPFIIKGITYAPTRVGESPDEGTLTDWTRQDINHNGKIDGPFDSWVDKNKNNIQDTDEPVIGDLKLLQDMGVNTIRVYHQPLEPDKKLFESFYKRGIMVIMGDFLGKYAIGSGADWEQGTDYSNPQQQERMMESVRSMVMRYKDEPYILMWLLGNENVYGLACNADKDPDSFFKFADKVAKMIKKIDPSRPVAIASGDTLFLDKFGKYCPDIDVFGANVYRGKYGFGLFWQNVKDVTGKAAMITEYGAPAYAQGYTLKEAEDFQAEYHRNAWLDIENNSCGRGAGNALGGIAFEWLDEWWKAYEPGYHDKKGLFTGPFLDGFMHEEWLGLCSQGDGKHSPFLRQLRKSYFVYKSLWNKNRLKGNKK